MQTIQTLEQKLINGEIEDSELDFLWEYYSARCDKIGEEWWRAVRIGNWELKERLDKRSDEAYKQFFDFVSFMTDYLIFKNEQCSNATQTA